MYNVTLWIANELPRSSAFHHAWKHHAKLTETQLAWTYPPCAYETELLTTGDTWRTGSGHTRLTQICYCRLSGWLSFMEPVRRSSRSMDVSSAVTNQSLSGLQPCTLSTTPQNNPEWLCLFTTCISGRPPLNWANGHYQTETIMWSAVVWSGQHSGSSWW